MKINKNKTAATVMLLIASGVFVITLILILNRIPYWICALVLLISIVCFVVGAIFIPDDMIKTQKKEKLHVLRYLKKRKQQRRKSYEDYDEEEDEEEFYDLMDD